MVFGSAGSTNYGAAKNMWAPAETGRSFDLSTSSLSPLEAFSEYITIVSNTDVPAANAEAKEEVGADHVRSSAVFLTQSHPKRTEGADVRAGVSLDQLYAQYAGHETPVPSIQLCIEDVARAGSSLQFGYSNVYRDTISWANPTTPLPMISDPRAVFNQLYGTSESAAKRSASILDWVVAEINRLSRNLPAVDRLRLDEYLTNVREVESRIQKIEAFNRSGEAQSATGSVSSPDDFEEHVKLMFDLQVQAFQSDFTRVSAFKMGLDGVSRTYPASGVNESFHAASHHGEHEEKIARFARINTYHVGIVTYFLDKLKNVIEGDKNLLDETLVIYGSPMGDSNFHNHKRCPLFLAGHAQGALGGKLHVKAADGTPMANLFVTILHALGMEDVRTFGDSTGMLSI
jgi:hypothetical protein